MKKAVLVADDSMIIRNIIESTLKDEFEVLKAENGKEAIDLITKSEFDIVGILLDLKMPDYDGFVVLDYFKDNDLFKKYPVSIISGDDTKDTIQKAFKYDIVDMLNKPFVADNIKTIVNKMISKKEDSTKW